MEYRGEKERYQHTDAPGVDPTNMSRQEWRNRDKTKGKEMIKYSKRAHAVVEK
jgi:hypothetical protein